MRIALVTTLVLASSVSAMAAQNGYQTINNPENRPMLGVQMTPVPLSTQEQQGLAPNQGVYVQSVYPNTAAETMGLQPGDVITSINGAGALTVEEFFEVVLPGQAAQNASVFGKVHKKDENLERPFARVQPAVGHQLATAMDGLGDIFVVGAAVFLGHEPAMFRRKVFGSVGGIELISVLKVILKGGVARMRWSEGGRQRAKACQDAGCVYSPIVDSHGKCNEKSKYEREAETRRIL